MSEDYQHEEEQFIESAADFLAAAQVRTKPARLPNGRLVRVKGLTGIERDRWERDVVKMHKGRKTVNVRGLLAARSLVDSDGNRLFPEEEALKLGGAAAEALQPIWEVAQELSGFSDDDLDELEEDLEDGPL